VSHLSGAVVRHVLIAQDLSEANAVASAMTTKGDLLTRNSTSTAAPQRLAVSSDLKYLRGRNGSTLGLQYDYAPIVFATTSARDAEITVPVAGMVCYVASGDSSEGLFTYNGTSWQRGPGWNAPWGRQAHLARVADQTGIGTSATDLTSLTVTFTAVANRYYKISADVFFLQNTSGGLVTVTINTGSSGAGTVLATRAVNTENGARFVSLSAVAIHTPSAGSVSYHLRGFTSANTVDLKASATQPSLILVEDIGPSGNPA
jgi:hypothetical protein